MEDRVLDYISLGMLIFVAITIIYGVIYIHDIPYEMAKKKNHPHKDAIHTAGWVSLFLMHTIWPFLWIWAALYKPEDGDKFKLLVKKEDLLEDEVKELRKRILALEKQLEEKKDS